MSFSAEMKDFIGAWEKGTKILGAQTDEEYKKAQTEAVKKKTETEYDPERLKVNDEQARANLEKTRAGVSLTTEQIKNAGVSRGYTSALTERLRKADAEIGGYQGNLPVLPTQGPAVGGAQPAPQVGLQPRTDLMEYEQGGAIPDMEEDQPEMDAGAPLAAPPAAVGPAVGPATGPTDMSARSRGPAAGLPQAGYQGVISPLLVSDAVRGGYAYGVQSLGMRGRATGARSKQAAMALASGAEALSPDEMELARKAVDPEGRLTDSQRNMAALGSVYQHWANKGDPKRAEKVAFQMLQHFRLASQRYAAIAAAAAEKGNMDMATKAALKAYANVPDGRDMQIVVGEDGTMKYNYTDENGKTISKGVATPEQFAAAAMGLARGGFDQAILSAAGQREAASGKTATKGSETAARGKAAVGDKVSDQKGRNEMIDPEITTLQTQWQKKNEGKEPDPEYWGNLKDAATHIMQQNPNATPREALAASQALADPKRSDDYKTTSEGGVNKIKFKDGATVTIDDDTFDVLISRRAAARAAMDKQEAQAKADAGKPSRLDQAVGGAKRIGGAVADLAGEAGQAVGAVGEAAAGAARRAIPDELATRGASAIRKVGEVAGDVADRFKNKGAIPETYDSPL